MHKQQEIWKDKLNLEKLMLQWNNIWDKDLGCRDTQQLKFLNTDQNQIQRPNHMMEKGQQTLLLNMD